VSGRRGGAFDGSNAISEPKELSLY